MAARGKYSHHGKPTLESQATLEVATGVAGNQNARKQRNDSVKNRVVSLGKENSAA
jgi:hypothetical protein